MNRLLKFDWFRGKRPAPDTCKANPGKAVKVSAGFTNGDKSWTEETDVMDCLSQALRAGGYSSKRKASWFELDSDLVIQPRFVELTPIEGSGVRTVTTIETSNGHTIPSGIFEFQHGAGDTLQNSIIKGFEGWMNYDLPVFLDALREKPAQCTIITFDLPANELRPALKRRVILGPVLHQVTKPVPSEKEEHPFCPCCLFTKTQKALKPKLDDGGIFGVRLLALRHEDGKRAADCRVNGEDWPSGEETLVDYAASWPQQGFEIRKQFVLFQNRR